MAGYVYIVLMGGAGGPIKIGICGSHPHKRMQVLQTGNPAELTLVGYKLVANPRDVEAALHGKFERQRIRNEWFGITVEQAKEALLLFPEDQPSSIGPAGARQRPSKAPRVATLPDIRSLLLAGTSKNAIARQIGGSKAAAYALINKIANETFDAAEK